jgi:hypothetical protein
MTEGFALGLGSAVQQLTPSATEPAHSYKCRLLGDNVEVYFKM